MKILVKSHFFGGEMCILSVDLNNNNLDKVDFYEDPIHVRVIAW